MRFAGIDAASRRSFPKGRHARIKKCDRDSGAALGSAVIRSVQGRGGDMQLISTGFSMSLVRASLTCKNLGFKEP